MMTAIYFPFTWADEYTIKAMTSVFQKTALFLPSKKSIESFFNDFATEGKLEIRIPVTDDSSRLDMLLNDYMSWARLHDKNDLASLKTRQPKIPFTDALSSKISSDILNYNNLPSEQKPDQVFNARLFLAMAADYDARQSELNSDFRKIHVMEKQILANLKDDFESDEHFPLENLSILQNDTRDFMLEERLKAWSLLFLQDRQSSNMAENILVTSSLSAIEFLTDEYRTEKILEIHCIPARNNLDENTLLWQESILEYLTGLQTRPWPSEVKTFEPPSSEYDWKNGVSVTGFIIPEKTPHELLQRMTGSQSYSSYHDIACSCEIKNTVLVYMETTD